jgi:hypothetical protein
VALLPGVGAAAILGQVVLLRELLVALYGSELVYLLAFAALLVFAFPAHHGLLATAALLIFAIVSHHGFFA